jgi:serine/threonine protein kinase
MGQAFIGRYRIIGSLGTGGMGTVVRALDEVRGREVALKLPLASDEDVITRLRRECDVLGQLEHHHIVSILGFGSEANVPFYIVMEYVDGATVEEMLLKEGPLEMRLALKIALGVTEALAYAHRPPLRIIHRDIKPGNVLVRRSDGMVKLTDFGIAAVLSQRAGNTAVGTMAYIAPEQALGQGADERSDLYSLGALLYEMLTGQRPPQLAAARATPPSMVVGSRITPDLADRADRLLLGLLERDPNRRAPKTAAEVADELQAMLDGRPSRLISGSMGSLLYEPTHRSSAFPQMTQYPPAPPPPVAPSEQLSSGYLGGPPSEALAPLPPPPSARRRQPAPYAQPQPGPYFPPQPQPVQLVPYAVQQPQLMQPVYQIIQVMPVVPPRPTSGKSIASMVLGILLMIADMYAFPAFLFSATFEHYDPATDSYIHNQPAWGGIFVWFLVTLLPIIFGHLALRDIKRSNGTLVGSGQAVAGLVMGYLGLGAVALLLFLLTTLLHY